jgi:hypothetical protein
LGGGVAGRKMGKTFKPPSPFAERGWRIKIRDRERIEPPHATVLFKTGAWRWGLRAWDRLYPGNRVGPEEADGHDG